MVKTDSAGSSTSRDSRRTARTDERTTGRSGTDPVRQQAQAGQTNQNAQRGGGGGARSVTTGDDGSFTFTDVNAGSYSIRVDRDGFLSQEYGQRSWTGSGVPVTLQAGQTLSECFVSTRAGRNHRRQNPRREL